MPGPSVGLRLTPECDAGRAVPPLEVGARRPECDAGRWRRTRAWGVSNQHIVVATRLRQATASPRDRAAINYYGIVNTIQRGRARRPRRDATAPLEIVIAL